MNEVEKMYKLANIKAKEYCDRDSDACMNCCPEWENRQNCRKYKSAMPSFTAEKQLKLIEFFISSVWWLNLKSLHKTLDYSLNFEDKLAKMVNYLWLSLTPEEKQQIKEILE